MAATSILLVDDDRDTCVSLSDILSDFGFGVDTVYDGASALKFSGRNDYRLALLGYRMPDMNGVELCRRLKSLQSEMEVALVTRFASAEIADAAIEVGVRKILPKPVDLARLIRFVETVIVDP